MTARHRTDIGCVSVVIQVDLTPGSNITITVKDDLDQTAMLVNQFVAEGDDDSCYTDDSY